MCLNVFFIKLQVLDLQLYLKKTSAQAFFRKFCEMFQNTYFVYDYRMLYKIGVLKNLAKLMAKVI